MTDPDSQTKSHRRNKWLLALAVFFACFALLEGGVIIFMHQNAGQSSWLTRLLPRNWISAPQINHARAPASERMVLVDETADLALIHEQINRLLAAFDNLPIPTTIANPSGFHLPMPMPSFPAERWAQLQNDIDRIFEGTFGSHDFCSLPHRLEQQWPRSTIASSMRIKDLGDCLMISMDLPGFQSSDISLVLQGRLLTVSARQAETQTQAAGSTSGYHARQQTMETKLMLPAAVNAETARASYNNGQLIIELLKTTEQAPLAKNIPLI